MSNKTYHLKNQEKIKKFMASVTKKPNAATKDMLKLIKKK
jgi:hypothetical protein